MEPTGDQDLMISEDENPAKGHLPIQRIGPGEKIAEPRDEKFDRHGQRLREYTQLLHMIGAEHPQSDAELESRSALDGLLDAIACLCVLEREVVCVMPKKLSADKLLALAVAQHDGGNKTYIIQMAKGLGLFGANGGSRPSMDGPGHPWMAWHPPLAWLWRAIHGFCHLLLA